MPTQGFLRTIANPHSVITVIDNGLRFPEAIAVMKAKYNDDILYFARLVDSSTSSADLLAKIRSGNIVGSTRMSLLKLFRRCVSTVCDTEASKKIRTIPTERIVETCGHTFKPISTLKAQFAHLTDELVAVLSVSMGEYDSRGQQGYVLTGLFFDWFEEHFHEEFTIQGPRGSGPDVELRTVVRDFTGACPCDFVIRNYSDSQVLAVGFARYDSTRGGAQSDDRTGGNVNKVDKIRDYCTKHNTLLRIVFLSDGPGLTHPDTWTEASELDGLWEDNVRVCTLKLAPERITRQWLRGSR